MPVQVRLQYESRSDGVYFFFSFFPFKYILNESLKKTVSELKEIIDKENIGLVVIGMPIGLKGKQTEISLKINEFISELEKNARSATD